MVTVEVVKEVLEDLQDPFLLEADDSQVSVWLVDSLNDVLIRSCDKRHQLVRCLVRNIRLHEPVADAAWMEVLADVSEWRNFLDLVAGRIYH